MKVHQERFVNSTNYYQLQQIQRDPERVRERRIVQGRIYEIDAGSMQRIREKEDRDRFTFYVTQPFSDIVNFPEEAYQEQTEVFSVARWDSLPSPDDPFVSERNIASLGSSFKEVRLPKDYELEQVHAHTPDDELGAVVDQYITTMTQGRENPSFCFLPDSDRVRLEMQNIRLINTVRRLWFFVYAYQMPSVVRVVLTPEISECLSLFKTNTATEKEGVPPIVRAVRILQAELNRKIYPFASYKSAGLDVLGRYI